MKELNKEQISLTDNIYKILMKLRTHLLIWVKDKTNYTNGFETIIEGSFSKEGYSLKLKKLPGTFWDDITHKQTYEYERQLGKELWEIAKPTVDIGFTIEVDSYCYGEYGCFKQLFRVYLKL